jgi:hypothetical protein
MKILLDIDDTAILTVDRGKTWNEHPRLSELLKNHSVFLYSGNPEITTFYKKWKAKGYIPKGTPAVPQGDVLIDNNADLEIQDCDVKEYFFSIDEFFKKYS